jgi:hypothetical protein
MRINCGTSTIEESLLLLVALRGRMNPESKEE